MARYATRYYPSIAPDDLRFVLVEAADAILPEVGPEMGRWTLEQLRERGIQVRLQTRLESCVGGHVVLVDGDAVRRRDGRVDRRRPAEPGAGQDRPASRRPRSAEVHGDAAGRGRRRRVGRPVTAPRSRRHRRAGSDLRADRAARRAAGEGAGRQHHRDPARASRCTSTSTSYVGSVAGLGLYKGVANVYGIKLRGWPAWFMHRTYHVSRVPTLEPQGAGDRGLDAGAVLQARDRVAVVDARAVQGVPGGCRPDAPRARTRRARHIQRPDAGGPPTLGGTARPGWRNWQTQVP